MHDLKKMHAKRPTVGIMIGDPCGIGPEVIAKAWRSGVLHAHCRPVLMGSAAVMIRAARLLGVEMRANQMTHVAVLADSPEVFDIIDAADFDADQVVYGQDIAESGRVCGFWLDDMDRRARSGEFDATVMGPISSHAMALGESLTSIATNKPETAYLLLRSGPLMIAHLCDHVPLRTVSSLITTGSVSQLIDSLNEAMTAWGLPSRRIAVAGFNPHAEGTEEHEAIRPAVRAAQVRGITVEGPASPDSVFRHCIEGRYDVVVAMYHDQGHIAMKTWGFAGNSVVILGPPYVHTTVAHGVAYEIAGKGQADETMIRNAILNAGSLATGRGFYE